ncbi:hypothetical protein OS493_008085 [Desmophyllum pertusum]|uniref:Uncharacterized protein n=1 Tax=Desmophyllum pertusum TaxID=174260 RepID=A0A9W9YEY4_9CNID|nr:hypothetical protein OS493_008085 [Desmophyllum pertusum]
MEKTEPPRYATIRYWILSFQAASSSSSSQFLSQLYHYLRENPPATPASYLKRAALPLSTSVDIQKQMADPSRKQRLDASYPSYHGRLQDRLDRVHCVFGCALWALEAKANPGADHEEDISVNRVKRSIPIIYDIYTLDHFIELVEKIERHTSTDGDTINKIVNYVRGLGYNTDLGNILCGKSDPLPAGILNSEEKRVLTNMVTYSYDVNSKRQMGVVLTHDRETIAMGRVMMGICAGLNRDKSLSLKNWTPGAPLRVDNLFTTTIAYTLGRSALF